MKKRYNKTIVIVLIMFFSLSCNKSFLDRNHPGSLTWDTLYKTEEDFKSALNGCYAALQGPVFRNILFGDILSDNVYISRYQISGPLADLDKLILTPSNGEINAYWSDNYTLIQRVNLLIDRISGAGIDDDFRNAVIAESLFLRAYAYFNLVRVFGGVPLYSQQVDVDEIYDVPRSTPEEVINLIISDLNEAAKIDDFRVSGSNTSGGKVSTIAAKTLLAKVYIWNKDYEKAENVLSDIVNNSDLELVDLSELYDPDKPINKEIILSINYERTEGFSSPFVSYFVPYNTPEGWIYPRIPGSFGAGYGNIEPYVASKYSSDDKRLQELIDTAAFENLGIVDTNIYSRKYVDTLTTINGLGGANTIILRYAEVLLMYAEVLNENGKTVQAYQYINQVRNRAGLDDLHEGYTKEEMFKALAEERQKEFLMEGDRWFDLIFRGMDFAKQVIEDYTPNAYLKQNRSLSVKDHFVFFPIPVQQLQVKPILNQNQGY